MNTFKGIMVVLLVILALVGLIYTQSFAQSKLVSFHTNTAAAANHATCWKTDSVSGNLVLSYCTNTVTSSGTCTCN